MAKRIVKSPAKGGKIPKAAIKKAIEKVSVSAFKPSREVSVEKIKNGYVVSKYCAEGNVKEHVKNKAAIGRVVNKMIGG